MLSEKNYSIYFVTIFLILNFNSALATIGNIILLRNENGQSLFLFLDIHRDYENGTLSKKQHAQFLTYAQYLNAHIIAEDMSHYEGSNAQAREHFENVANSWEDFGYEGVPQKEPLEIINDVAYYQDFFLLNLIRHCRSLNISHFNVECRHIATQSNMQNSTITAQEVARDYQKTIAEIEHELATLKANADKKHVPFLNLCKNKLTMVIDENKPLIEYLNDQTKTLWEITNKDFIVNLEGRNYTVWYDRELVDFKILIDIYKNRNNQNIFVCAGGSHVINIIFALSKLGYKEVPMLHNGVSLNPLPETQYVLDNAPDLKKYFFHAYRHLLICNTCHKQQSHEKAYFAHELQCLRNAQAKKFSYCTASLATGFGIYKALC